MKRTFNFNALMNKNLKLEIMTYECPSCCHEMLEYSNFCPDCGAELLKTEDFEAAAERMRNLKLA